jgi:CubicO group peptidase (beta-lactamase class C family)
MPRPLVLAVALLGAALVSPACAGPASPPDPSRAIVEQAVDAPVRALMADPGYRSLTVAVSIDGRLETFHFGRLPSGERPDDLTRYGIGSITKTYTGLLLAQAVRDGRIRLDDPVSDYLPDVPPEVFRRDGAVVTIRHLATHLSGLPVNLACTDPGLSPPAMETCLSAHDRADFFARLRSLRLEHAPGEQYVYSGAGSRLLGYVLERVYGDSYFNLLRRFVFSRTGETRTRCWISAADVATLAVPAPAAPDADGSACTAERGLMTTTADFGKYMARDDALARAAGTPLVQSGDWGRAYQWNTYRPETEGQLYHGGGTGNTSAWVSLYPREGLGVFLVTPYVAPDADVQAQLNEAANAIVARLRERDR